MPAGVVGQAQGGEEAVPLSRVLLTERPDLVHQRTVIPFHLTVCLRVKSVWSSVCVALLWQRSWAVSGHLMYPRRPHDRSSGSPLSKHTHVPQFSVRAGRGAPP